MALEIRNVSKEYGQLSVLEDVSFTVQDGEFCCIVGPSGCGKTTLLRIIAGLVAPSAGEVLLNDRKLCPDCGEIGFIFQEDTLFPWLTVEENVRFGLEVKGSDRKTIEAVSRYYLDLVGLSDFARFYPKQLSGGMRQRLALARSLAYNPAVLIMDEPFSSLDYLNRQVMQRELLRIWSEERKTVVFVTHDIDEALFLADLLVVFSSWPKTAREILRVAIPKPRRRTAPDFIKLKDHILDLLCDIRPD